MNDMTTQESDKSKAAWDRMSEIRNEIERLRKELEQKRGEYYLATDPQIDAPVQRGITADGEPVRFTYNIRFSRSLHGQASRPLYNAIGVGTLVDGHYVPGSGGFNYDAVCAIPATDENWNRVWQALRAFDGQVLIGTVTEDVFWGRHIPILVEEGEPS